MKSISRAIKAKIPPKKFNKSYSQEGEDMLLLRAIGNKSNGFYVDIGSHHPTRFSNTKHFYDKGWRGINIDPLPGSKDLFDKKRPKDINLELAIGKPAKLTYYMYDEPALNTFDVKMVEQRKKDKAPYNIIHSKKISIKPLSAVLRKHLPKGMVVDFMTIDVEGKDLEALQTNDWSKVRPKIILIECHGYGCVDLVEDKKVKYLSKYGYKPIAKTVSTVLLSNE